MDDICARFDEEKYGQKLLEKFGWEKGKGLGAQKQGITDIITVKSIDGSKGLGFEGNPDEWLAHQDGFSAVLANLNQEHCNNSEPLHANEKMVFEEEKESLENKSKGTKKRIHYHKFAKSKDTSSYSSSDLSCILGLEAVSKKKKNNDKENHFVKQENKLPFHSHERNDGLVTINGGNINDYFAKKMAEIRRKFPENKNSLITDNQQIKIKPFVKEDTAKENSSRTSEKQILTINDNMLAKSIETNISETVKRKSISSKENCQNSKKIRLEKGAVTKSNDLCNGTLKKKDLEIRNKKHKAIEEKSVKLTESLALKESGSDCLVHFISDVKIFSKKKTLSKSVIREIETVRNKLLMALTDITANKDPKNGKKTFQNEATSEEKSPQSCSGNQARFYLTNGQERKLMLEEMKAEDYSKLFKGSNIEEITGYGNKSI